MRVEDVMTREVYTCAPGATAREALEIMWSCDVGVVPIVNEQRQVVGLVTDRDLAMAGLVRGAPPHQIPIGEVTSHRVWSVGPNDTLEHAEQLMEKHQVRRLPVLDERSCLVGIVTLADLTHARKDGVLAEDVAHTLAAITTPRPVQPTA
jgi:CBS domain-containing protein